MYQPPLIKPPSQGQGSTPWYESPQSDRFEWRKACMMTVVGVPVAIILALVLGLVAIVIINERQRSTEDWWEDTRPIMLEFQDTLDTASNTSRIGLPPIILELQRQRREVAAVETPDEAKPARDALVEAMDSMINVLQKFASGKEEDELTAEYDATTAAWDQVWEELDKIGIRSIEE